MSLLFEKKNRRNIPEMRRKTSTKLSEKRTVLISAPSTQKWTKNKTNAQQQEQQQQQQQHHHRRWASAPQLLDITFVVNIINIAF